MHLYRTKRGAIVKTNDNFYKVDGDWNELLNDDALPQRLSQHVRQAAADPSLADAVADPLKPIIDQEIWAAGVTYFRSKTARMEEAQQAGGGNFYDRVYEAPRPEIFFKATPSRTVGPGETMCLRSDSKWIVPEPELTLVVTSNGTVIGYTCGNDLSCRDIEGENPLYLPQAKTFDRCAAVGPCILVSELAPKPDTEIRLSVIRGGTSVVNDKTNLGQMKRKFDELVGYLIRHNRPVQGCLLMTGTGIVPPDNFCLEDDDIVEIEIDGVGKLSNLMKSDS